MHLFFICRGWGFWGLVASESLVKPSLPPPAAMFSHAESIKKKEVCALAYSPFCFRSSCSSYTGNICSLLSWCFQCESRSHRKELKGKFKWVFVCCLCWHSIASWVCFTFEIHVVIDSCHLMAMSGSWCFGVTGCILVCPPVLKRWCCLSGQQGDPQVLSWSLTLVLWLHL